MCLWAGEAVGLKGGVVDGEVVGCLWVRWSG